MGNRALGISNSSLCLKQVGGFPTTHKGKRFVAAFYEVRRTKLDTAPAN
ncbi:hypothetical protein [aff. Roholtiella sp. LEGE 12411]